MMSSKSTLHKYLSQNGITLNTIENGISLHNISSKQSFSDRIEELISEENVTKRYANVLTL